MKKLTYSFHLRMSEDDALLLKHIAKGTGTSATNFARELIKNGLYEQASDLLLENCSLEEKLNTVLDKRIVKLEKRFLQLFIGDILCSLETRSLALKMIRVYLANCNYKSYEIDFKIEKLEKAAKGSAEEKLKEYLKIEMGGD